MKKDSQLAQTGTKSGTETNTVASTNCSICRGKNIEKREAINRALGKGISYRDIEAMTGVAYRTIGNHAQHLPEIFKEARDKGILSQPVDVHQEFSEQLAFAKSMRVAAKDYLSHPETGEICLFPRSTEVSVVYEDFSDLTPKGEPKKKVDALDILLDRVKEGNIEQKRTIIKHVDMRSFALDVIRTVDVCIDKFAKLEGSYQKEKENNIDEQISAIHQMLLKLAEENDTDFQYELRLFLEDKRLHPDIKSKLITQIVQ